MDLIYSTYEAKARFSELLRHVRAGRSVTVSYRGEPVAEIRPIRQAASGIQARLEELESSGALVRSSGPRRPLTASADRPGALDRFLAERDE